MERSPTEKSPLPPTKLPTIHKECSEDIPSCIRNIKLVGGFYKKYLKLEHGATRGRNHLPPREGLCILRRKAHKEI